MRVCPFFMFNPLFFEAVNKAVSTRKQITDLKKWSQVKEDLFYQFYCPVITVGIDCPFHVIKDDKGNDIDRCNCGGVNFNLNVQQMNPEIMPPFHPIPGFRKP